jgi:hypothetical protein
MKTDKLESFVRENRQEFDQFEPSPQSWEKISKQLEEQGKKSPKRLNWLSIAAAIIVIVTIPAIVYQLHQTEQPQAGNFTQIDPDVQQLIEAEAYYAQEVSGKLTEIRRCYNMYPDLKDEIEGDLIELENMYRSLKSDLKENISNKEVIEAMIENNRNRLKLVDEVLEQINC